MITLVLSFFLTLVNPTPLGKAPETPPALYRPSVVESSEAPTVAIQGSLVSRPGPAHPETPEDLRVSLGGPWGEAGDGWDRVRRLLAAYAPGSSSGKETAERQS